MIPVRSDLFANLDEDAETQTPIVESLRDDEEFLTMMNARGPHNTTQAVIETSPLGTSMGQCTQQEFLMFQIRLSMILQ